VAITVITGPPGAGKTTVSAALARTSARSVHLQADQCFRWIASGFVAPWSPESNEQNATVIDAIGAAAGAYTAGGYHVVVDGIVGPWFLERFLRAAHCADDDIAYVIIRPAREIAMARALGRAGDDDLVDPVPVSAMFDVFEGIGTFEANVIDSSSLDVAATVAAIVEAMATGRAALRDGHHAEMARLSERFGVPPIEGSSR
jgi:adenylate kinase family enzyme